MLFTNESAGPTAAHETTLRYRLVRRISSWTIRPLQGLVHSAIAVAVYLASHLFLQALAPDFHLLPGEWSWNLAGGLSFGFLVALGPAYIPAVFFAQVIPLVADGSTAVSGWSVMLFAAGNSAAFGSASYFARRLLTATGVDLEDRRTLLVTLTLIPITGLLAACGSATNWWLAGAVPQDALLEAFLVKAFGNGMGLLLVGPFVLLNGMPLLRKLVDRSKTFAMPETGELVQGAVWLHLAAGSVVATALVGMDRFDSYLLFYVALIAMALKFGLRGLAASFLVVGCAKSMTTLLGYTASSGLPIETTILAALISGLIVAGVATERNRAVHTVRKQAGLIVEAVARARQKGHQHENDLKAVLKHLVTEVEATASLYGIEDEDDDAQNERELLLERLEELIDGGRGRSDIDPGPGEAQGVGGSPGHQVESAPTLP